MGAADLERWLHEGPLSNEAARVLGVQNASTTSATSAAVMARGLEPNDARFEQWQRIPLLAGLDLMLRADANNAARVAAQRIYEQCVAAVGEEWPGASALAPERRIQKAREEGLPTR
jgi:hypothetical protein